MSFTRNFEIRRYAPTLHRDGNLKTKTGTSLRLGTVVKPGTGTDAGKVVAPAAGDTNTVGAGVLWFEHIQYQGVDPNLVLYVDRDTAPANNFVQVLTGKGVRLEYRNTPAVTLADGRTRAAVKMVDVTTAPAVGKYVSVKADGTLSVSATAAGAAPGTTDFARIVEVVSTTADNEVVVVELLG